MPITKHQEYDRLSPRWTYAWDVYTGEYADQGKIQKYLVQRKQGEADAAYNERKELADPALDFATVVDSLVGMQFTAEAKTKRTWEAEGSGGGPSGEGLGDPQERGTIARRLMTNVDAKGTNLETLLKRAAVRLTAVHRVWGLVDPAVVEEGTTLRPAAAMLVDPRDVVNWRSEKGRLVQVLARDRSDSRSDIREDFDDTTYYTLYELSGWTRMKESGDSLVPTGQTGEYAFYRSARQEQKILPIFRVDLPLPRMVGHLLARKCVALFNTESELDNLLRLCCMPRFGVEQGEYGYTDFDDVVDSIAEGHAILQGAGHQYIAPPSDPAMVRIERLKQKRQDFYAVGFREYGDAASEATATEKRQDWAAGVAAFLTLQAGALQEFELEMMRRFEQAEFADRPDLWGVYDVERSTDFEPENVREVLSSLADKVFGMDGLPVDADTATSIVEKLLSEHGVDAERDALAEAVRQQFDQAAQRRDAGVLA